MRIVRLSDENLNLIDNHYIGLSSPGPKRNERANEIDQGGQLGSSLYELPPS